MQFWSGTAFLNTADALAVTRMLDETGFDGMICADHLIYPPLWQGGWVSWDGEYYQVPS